MGMERWQTLARNRSGRNGVKPYHPEPLNDPPLSPALRWGGGGKDEKANSLSIQSPVRDDKRIAGGFPEDA